MPENFFVPEECPPTPVGWPEDRWKKHHENCRRVEAMVGFVPMMGCPIEGCGWEKAAVILMNHLDTTEKVLTDELIQAEKNLADLTTCTRIDFENISTDAVEDMWRLARAWILQRGAGVPIDKFEILAVKRYLSSLWNFYNGEADDTTQTLGDRLHASLKAQTVYEVLQGLREDKHLNTPTKKDNPS